MDHIYLVIINSKSLVDDQPNVAVLKMFRVRAPVNLRCCVRQVKASAAFWTGVSTQSR